MAVDRAQARELGLFIENDGTLYRQITTYLIKNYARKKAKGIFDKQQALKGIVNSLVEAGRRKYIRDFGSIGGVVSADTKMEVAKYLYPHINEVSSEEAKELKKLMNKKTKSRKR